MDVNKVPPVQRMQLPRFTAHSDWELTDMSVDSTRVAVCGYNYSTRTTSIDLFTLDVSDSTPLIQHQRPIFSRVFPLVGGSIWLRRYVSLIDGDSSHIVTVSGSQLDLYNIHSNDDHRTVTYRDGEARCVAVSETGDIYIGLYPSNKVIVLDGELNIIKSITLNGMERYGWPVDITVKRNNLFISTGHSRAQRYNMDGELLNQYNKPDQDRLQAFSITVSSKAGLVFVLWLGSRCPVVAVYSLADGHSLFTFDVDVVDLPPWSRIRLSSKGNRLIATTRQGELIVYNTPMKLPFYFESLKKILSDFLSSDDCQQLGNFFELSSQELDAVSKSQSPVKDLINALEEREIVYSANISRLLQALCHLELNDKAIRSAELYMKYNGEETLYERFLAALSSHLTLSVPERLCEYFKLRNWRKGDVTASQSPGLTLLTVLDEMGLIHQFDVNALIPPLRELQLVQAVAKVEEYQSLIIESKQMKKTTISTLEGKRMLFIECVRKKIKTWYETMTPIPWRKSCKWTSSELFVPCGLILTGTRVELKVGNIDPDCKLQYRDIFTYDRLKSETRIIIEGGPGSGKTMLLSQLAYDWSIDNIHDVNIVIFLPLMFAKDMTIFEAIEKFYVPSDVPLTADDIESLLNQASEESKTFILLDGLEVYNGRPKDKEPSEVVKVMKKEKLSNCRVLLSSCSDFEQDLLECPRLRLQQFSEEERDMYIGNVFPDNKEKQETVKNAIKNSDFLQDLCTSPLLLVLVVHNMEHLVQYEGRGQQESLGPFMQALIDTLRFHAHLDNREQSQSQVQSARLSEIAFNGLCKGYRQLHWQKSFLDRTVSDIKEWTESGILVAQDDLMVREEQQLNYQAETKKQISPSAIVDTGRVDALILKKIESQRKSKLDREMWSISGTSEQKMYDLSDMEEELLEAEKQKITSSRQSGYKGKVKQHQRKQMLDRKKLLISETSEDEMIDVIGKDEELYTEDLTLHPSSGIERKLLQHVSDPSTTFVPSRLRQKQSSSSNLHDVSLQIKFLHEVIQEWFAAIHLSSTLKHLSKGNQRLFLNRHLPLITPADLPYILQFTSYLCPGSCHLIMENLLSVYKQADGAVPEYILNCIFLCFAEVDSSGKDERMDKAVRQVCKNTVTIRGEDSRLLQQSKVSMLTYASKSKINIKHLKLVNVVVEVSESVIIFNSNLTLPSLPHLQVIEVSHWDQKLKQKDYTNLIHFFSKCQSLKGSHLHFPNLPPEITDRQLLSCMQKMTVEWSIGKNLMCTLNKETGKWKREFRRPASLSEASDTVATQVMVNESGGVVSIPDTGVKLEVPPGALMEKTLIRMRIITHHFQDDHPLSFKSNSSTVVELLPSRLKLLKPTKLTLPHCLVLKKNVTWTAKVYSSHHEEGKPPQWEEEKDTYSELNAKTCVIWLKNFSWKTFEVVDGENIEAKEIILYAARRLSSTETTVYVDVGYVLDLPKALEVDMPRAGKVLLHHHSTLFYKDGRLPLKVVFEKTKPKTWKFEHSKKKREIPFENCAILRTDFCEFVFGKIKTKGDNDCKCYFQAGQKGKMKNLVFSLQKPSLAVANLSKLPLPEEPPPENRHDDQQRSISSQGASPDPVVVDDDNLRECGISTVVASSNSSEVTGLSSKTKKKRRKKKKARRSESSALLQEPSLAMANLSKLPNPEEPPPENRQDNQRRSISSQGAVPSSAVINDGTVREGAVAESSSESHETGTLPKLKGDESRPSSNVLTFDLPADNGTCRAKQSKDHTLDKVPTTPSKKPKLDCRVDESTLWWIAQEIPGKWRNVGRNLEKVEESDIKNLKADQSIDNKERAYQILLLWKQRNGKDANYSDLKEALIKAGRKDVSDKLLS